MKSTEAVQAPAPQQVQAAGAGDGARLVPPLDVLYDELARLESAHEQLLRYAQDLKRAYEAERERRARLAQATLDLVAVLAVALRSREAA